MDSRATQHNTNIKTKRKIQAPGPLRCCCVVFFCVKIPAGAPNFPPATFSLYRNNGRPAPRSDTLDENARCHNTTSCCIVTPPSARAGLCLYFLNVYAQVLYTRYTAHFLMTRCLITTTPLGPSTASSTEEQKVAFSPVTVHTVLDSEIIFLFSSSVPPTCCGAGPAGTARMRELFRQKTSLFGYLAITT